MLKDSANADTSEMDTGISNEKDKTNNNEHVSISY